MKMKSILILSIISIGIMSCQPEEVTPGPANNESTSILGEFDCSLSAGAQNESPCTMNVSQMNDTIFIEISGVNISPNIELKGIEVDGQVNILPCSDECYQGDMNVGNNGTLKSVSNKKKLNFGVYDPSYEDETDAIWIAVNEL